ncbi:RagB/SusD family nutrient uptake outer membrane protein [Bacteroides sp. GM023]|uniref:RagB/SusD family nutrient uptake outer membrane protein n=1 Tax=Bacteroides sp. GM023 TaxID=2723058 RepID=UPI00168B80E2|nr:RagB/SusD family nutrient uptake outer membrane protein [Bacteroides sp. GM023]MBD3592375.1 RagB/SusD family nutrient uptake outer membrane protein [Bacteroides sp. GM023]
MKKIWVGMIAICILGIHTGCEDFLDKSPDMGLSEDDVYKDYASIRGFMDRAYNFLDNFHLYQKYNNGRTYIGAISDEFASLYNFTEAKPINSGSWLSKEGTDFEIGNSNKNGGTSIWKAYQGIRIVNRVIRDIDMVSGLTEQQKNELLGQSHFLRAWFYFQLINRYGGMPIFDKLFVGDGDEDLPRKTYHESHDWMMTDIEKAVTMLPDMWDDNNAGRPNKIAAMSFKSMAQLYDASPLMQNDLSSIQIMKYDADRAKTAAKSANAVLKYIKDHPEMGYRLMEKEEYTNIFYWKAPPYMQPEYLWYNRSQEALGEYNYKRYIRAFWLAGEYASGTGNDAVAYNAPTQNMVDIYEKQGDDGLYYPITHMKASYDDQHPYDKRDPRFYNNILYPGNKWGENKSGKDQYITTYVGGNMYNTVINNNQTNKRQQTGYLCKKFLWEGADQWKELYGLNRVITVYIRVAQIYLDLAEASFEATGSVTTKVEGCDYSALEAINIIRNRVGIGNVPSDIYNDSDAFRQAIRRERTVELMFENHRWWDIRRWMIAHELFTGQYPIKGIEATPKNKDHAKVADKSTLEFTFKTIDVIPEIRVFEMKNYWYPFSMNDAASLNNLEQNPGW